MSKGRASSPAFTSSESVLSHLHLQEVLLRCLVVKWGMLTWVMQLMRTRNNSPKCCSWWGNRGSSSSSMTLEPAHLPQRLMVGGISPWHMFPHGRWVMGATFPFLPLQDWLTHTSTNRDGSILLRRLDGSPALLSVAIGGGQGQLALPLLWLQVQSSHPFSGLFRNI